MTTKQTARDKGAKIPADRLAAAEVTGETVTVTVRGHELTFDPNAVQDYRLQKRIAKGDGGAVAELIEIVLGDEEDAIVDELAEETGHVSMPDVMAVVNEAAEAAGLGKR